LLNISYFLLNIKDHDTARKNHLQQGEEQNLNKNTKTVSKKHIALVLAIKKKENAKRFPF